jgi:hypothetical protein
MNHPETPYGGHSLRQPMLKARCWTFSYFRSLCYPHRARRESLSYFRSLCYPRRARRESLQFSRWVEQILFNCRTPRTPWLEKRDVRGSDLSNANHILRDAADSRRRDLVIVQSIPILT